VKAVRVRRVLTLFAALAVAVVLSPAGSTATSPAKVALPTLYVQYTMNCTFSIIDDRGSPVTAIAPGLYQVEVSTPMFFKLAVPGGVGVDNIAPDNFYGCKGWVQFQLTGPGVNLSTTLDTGCDAFLTLPAQVFKPGSTYTAQDLNQPSLTRTAFTTLTSGTPLPPPRSPYSTLSGKTDTQKELAGSEADQAKPKATLTGTLGKSGALTALKTNGKAVLSLKAGRYKFTITDQDPKGAVTLKTVDSGTGIVGKKVTKDLSGWEFVGRHTTYVTLTAGRWMYYSDRAKANYFLVTG
jgi:hypothetical protein